MTFAGAYYGWSELGVPFAFIVLFGFFFTSVWLSRIGVARKRRLDVAKGGPRDAWQVAANGGVATLCAVVAALATRGHGISHVAFALFWAFAGAYAAATADTWSTEIGSAFGGTPRAIVGWQRVAAGESGGVTPLGTLAMMGGAAWIGFLWAAPQGSWSALWIVAIAGCAGAIVDSLLGATLQRVNFCPACAHNTESLVHGCGTSTKPLRGLAWMNNDIVNALGTLAGALVGGALFFALL
ncbi:MAG: DUF92 domain-containing protein [Vulcanimicrobiaceae bacterium]